MEEPPPPPPSSSSSSVVVDAPEWVLMLMHATLSMCYAILSAISCWSLGKRCRRAYKTKELKNKWQVWFHVLFILGCWSRAIYFALICINNGIIPHAVNSLLNYIPSYIYFSCYFIVLMCWAEIYHSKLSTSTKFTHKLLQFILVSVNCLLYLFLISLVCAYTADVVEDGSIGDSLTSALIWMTVSIYFILAGGFLMYGCLILYKLLSQHNFGGSPTARAVLPRVTALTLMCTCCFVTRAVLMIVTMNDTVSESYWWVDISYYLGLEILPLILMLVLLRVQSSQKREKPKIEIESQEDKRLLDESIQS
ncbi:DUF1084 domain-containing protein [Pelomyxa schiedti]|nr:DUF1084 domain-containing protein [Pelomyxa schiedti]